MAAGISPAIAELGAAWVARIRAELDAHLAGVDPPTRSYFETELEAEDDRPRARLPYRDD